jgi:fused signal recognition particle receptor
VICSSKTARLESIVRRRSVSRGHAPMEIVYVLVGVAVLAAVYFLFLKPKAEPQLKAPPEEHRLPGAGAKAPARSERPVSDRPSQRPTATRVEEFAAEEPSSSQAPSSRESAPPRSSLTHVRDVESLRRGLAKSRGNEGFFGKLRALFGGKKDINVDIAEGIEEVLLTSDVGVRTTDSILSRVRDTLSGSELVDSAKVWDALREEARRILSEAGNAGAFRLRNKPTVVLMVGVNGAGKTTTIGKLATKLRAEGRKCVLAAGDTFRAAAVQQLIVWGERVGCEVVRGKDGADPGSVIFDAIKKAVKTVGKAMESAPHEVLLVLDATNGQNALAQASEFKEALPLTGIVLTKLDGTAKGGMILGICDTLNLPVRFIGLGERPDDLHDFSPDEFVEALLGKESEASAV